VTSAELAGVREVTPTRVFRVTNEDGIEHVVCYSVDRDSLHCSFHKTDDNCTCTSRVRLCGIVTGHVINDVKQWKKGLAVIQGGAA
jgi:hypothetical protein